MALPSCASTDRLHFSDEYGDRYDVRFDLERYR